VSAYLVTWCLSHGHCWNCDHSWHCSRDCAADTAHFQQIQAGMLSGWHGPEYAETAGLLCETESCQREEEL